MSTAVVMESLVGIVLFTIIIVPFTLRNPLILSTPAVESHQTEVD